MTTPRHSLPADVLTALEQGQKIEAIKRLRNATGLGLKEAKEAVEACEASADASRVKAAGLAPGEVPKTSGAGRWLVALVLMGLAAYYFFRRVG